MDQITLRDDSAFLNIGNLNLDEAELSTAFAKGMDFNDPELMKEMEELCNASIADQTLLSNNMTGTVSFFDSNTALPMLHFQLIPANYISRLTLFSNADDY